MEEHDGIILGSEGLAFIGIGTEDDRILQPLAHVHGHDLHTFGIAFEADARLFILFFRLRDLLLQPVNEMVVARMEDALLMEEFDEVKEVSQAALRVSEDQKPCCDRHASACQPRLVNEGGCHPHEAVL